MESKSDKKLMSIANGFLFMWALCFFTPIALFVWFQSSHGPMPEAASDWGVIGDFVGGLSNPVISSITFLALIFTILQNQKILRFTEEQLTETRTEIELTREANEKQAEELKAQNEMMQKDSENQAVTKALLELGSRMRGEWEGHELPKKRPKLAFTFTYEKHVQELKTRSDVAVRNQGLIVDYLPMVVSYIKLLLLFREGAPDHPMLRTLVCLVGDVLMTVYQRGFLRIDLSDEELRGLEELLATYYPNTIEDVVLV
ncbi:hypothetical protein ACMXYQ_05220 [Neptuniibacter sp. PT34_22]|uniref:hypothetical protein n=1 Tax=Neptuniibacter sp. PT34_22 TaxID=3398205 RepID=UPI0039F46DA6